MEPKIEAQLSFELQEMYLEHKEWSNDILFLEDEMRFFQQIFEKILASPIDSNQLEQVEFIKSSLIKLQERRVHLKSILNKRKHSLEAMLKDEMKTISLNFIEEDAEVVSEIKSLLATDQAVKKELFALIEELQSEDQTHSLLKALKNQRYPIL